jgi:uncharacterized protein YggE
MSTRPSPALSLCFSLLLAACATQATSARAQERIPPPQPHPPASPPHAFHPPRSIVVTGTGEARVAPDEAFVDLAVETQAKTAKEASQQNARRMEAVVAALVAAGVPRKDVETRNYNLFPEYAQDPQPRPDRADTGPRLVGYRASNNVQVRTRALDQLGSFIDKALAAGANRVEGVRFGLSNPQEAQGLALADAVKRARASAEVIARSLGLALGEVLEASTQVGHPPVYPVDVPMHARGAMMEMAKDASTPITPGEQTVQASVSLRYAIGR